MALCIPAKTAGEVEAKAAAAPAAANKVLSVSTSDIGLAFLAERQVSAAKTKEALDLKNCIYKPLVRIIAKTILHNMTRSIVGWINSGFRGSPAFVTDPKGFFTGVADQSFGKMIEDIAPVLCQPFRFQLQLGLGFQYSATSKDEVRCKLSDVITNIQGFYDSFVEGTFSAGGWESWINIAGVPQNNAYGAYLAAQGQISAGIVDAQERELKLLDWGKGFQSWRVCKKYEEKWTPEAEARGKPDKGKCEEYGPIKTPGAAIVDQTSGALQSELRQLEVAQEIDEIFGALVSQLLVRAFGGSSGGLSGLSQPDSSGVIYINTIPTSLDDPRLNNNIPKPHPDIDCTRNYVAGGVDPGSGRVPEFLPLLTTLLPRDISTIYPNGQTTLPNRVNDILLVEARDNATGFPTGLNEIARSNKNNQKEKDNSTPPKEVDIPYSGEPILKPKEPLKDAKGNPAVLKGNNANGPTWEAYMTAIGVACSREANDDIIKRGLKRGEAEGANEIISGGVSSGISPQRETPPQTEIVDGNISSGKFAEQISDYIENKIYYLASNAVDGSDTSVYSSSITQEEAFPWWQIDLSKQDSRGQQVAANPYTIEEIREIEISRRIDEPRQTSNLWIFISAQPFEKKPASALNYFNQLTSGAQNNTYYQVPDGGNRVTVRMTRGEKGPYVRIQMSALREHLSLPEVRIDGKATRTTQTPGAPAQAQELPLLITAKPAQGTIIQKGSRLGLNPRRGEDISQIISFKAENKAAEGVRLEAQLFMEVRDPNSGVSTMQPRIWNTIFSSFTILQGTAGIEFITKTSCFNNDPQCFIPIMNINQLKDIDPGNEGAVNSGGKILFKKPFTLPKDSTVDLTLNGTLNNAVVAGNKYRIVITATKPKTLNETQDTKVESKNDFTIAP